MTKTKDRGPNWHYKPGVHVTIGFPTYPEGESRPNIPPWGERDGRRTVCIQGINVVVSTSRYNQLSRKQRSGR